VRLECLRLLATLKLDPARSQLIGGFIGTYLKLNAEEMQQYEQEFAKLTPEEKEVNMELMNPWVRQGWEEGRQAGKEEFVLRQLNRRVGSLSSRMTERFNHLSP
jgi:flagellar biosynthesis/type III secretory pathway protein FliH